MKTIHKPTSSQKNLANTSRYDCRLISHDVYQGIDALGSLGRASRKLNLINQGSRRACLTNFSHFAYVDLFFKKSRKTMQPLQTCHQGLYTGFGCRVLNAIGTDAPGCERLSFLSMGIAMVRVTQLAVVCVAVVVATAGQTQGSVIIYDTITAADNLTVADLTSNGWTSLYDEFYADDTVNADLQSWLSSGFEYLMLGGTLVSTGEIQLAGVIRTANLAPFTSGNNTNTFAETSNYWYNRLNYSIGFAPNSSVSLNSADTIDGPGRLSWHMHTFAAGGYRLGAVEHLNGSTQYTKFVLGANASSPVPEPSSLALFGIATCVAGVGAARRRRREKKQVTA